ncbi:hypothetical protein WJX73_003937 [Symbiochloris irregularis]|uniref:Cilia- and flagella-associated protein 52 n=1 Tax=Symbiochloris irregularis TaxID=706552 RepID=A0AAW1PMV0_9CHLO
MAQRPCQVRSYVLPHSEASLADRREQLAKQVLCPKAFVGFSGDVRNGLLALPDGETWVRASGSSIILGRLSQTESSSIQFLSGHSDRVTCMALSKSGKLLASGQVTSANRPARIVIWDLLSGVELCHMELHQGMVQDMDFCNDDSKLASIGGPDDKRLALWDVASGKVLSTAAAASAALNTVRFLPGSGEGLATAGVNKLTLWELDASRHLVAHPIQTGSLRRSFTALCIDESNNCMYCSTASGDLIVVDLQRKLMAGSSPNGKSLGHSINSLTLNPEGDLILGTADGSVHVMRSPSHSGPQSSDSYRLLASKKLCSGSVTTIIPKLSSTGAGMHVCGCQSGSIHLVGFDAQARKLSAETLSTAHAGPIHGIAFPEGYAKVFATCGSGGVRVWETGTCRQLLQLQLAGTECTSITFSKDGALIITGWSDGRIRGFGPQTGAEKFIIHGAHNGPVAALACTHDSARIISGGGADGNLRVWNVSSQALVASMVEHQAGINCISLRDGPGVVRPECVSAGADGSCIVWDMATCRRRTTLLANTCFKAVVHHPDGSQIITVGTDRQISYWDAFSGQAIRIIQGSHEKLNWLAIDARGKQLVTADHALRVWNYDEGTCCAVGSGHGDAITALEIAPDRSCMISVDAAGAIMLWSLP